MVWYVDEFVSYVFLGLCYVRVGLSSLTTNSLVSFFRHQAAAIKHFNPGVIIDMATLTGAQTVATGKHFGALYCNDEKLENIAIDAGRLSGDLCHPMPYAPEFFKAEYTSAFAGELSIQRRWELQK